MAHYYLDSSALVKCYVSETGTDWVQFVCSPRSGHTIYTVRISLAEIVSALYRHVRMNSLSETDARAATARLKSDFRTAHQIVEVTEPLVERVMSLAEEHGLRGYDSVQLAAALELQAVRASFSLSTLTFVSADESLNQAAGAESLPVEDPATISSDS